MDHGCLANPPNTWPPESLIIKSDPWNPLIFLYKVAQLLPSLTKEYAHFHEYSLYCKGKFDTIFATWENSKIYESINNGDPGSFA